MSTIYGFAMHVTSLDAHTAVVELHGEMDAYTAPRARETLLRLLADGQYNLILDLQRIQYIDSTGLGAMIGILRRAREYGGTIRLVSPTPPVRRLLEITRLTYTFPIDATASDTAIQLARG